MGNEERSKPQIPTPTRSKPKKNIRSRVVPFNCSENSDETPTNEGFEDQKEFEDMSLIHRQLEQIETQQSNLLELLQVLISIQRGSQFFNTLCHCIEICTILASEIHWELSEGHEFFGETSRWLGEGPRRYVPRFRSFGWEDLDCRWKQHMLYDSRSRILESQILEENRISKW